MISKMQCRKYLFLFMILFAVNTAAQTSSFTYQGRLTDTGAAANGSYDLRFSLYDAGGIQIGAAQTFTNTVVINGVFTVQLDFGSNAFPGAERFLEIAVKQPNETNYTVLTPRQRVTSSPYSIKSFNADTAINSTQLGGITANQYVLTNDTRLSDDRNPLAGSNNYIQNTLSQQTSANFNIGGTGTANIFNAGSQFNLGGSRVLFSNATTSNTIAGLNTGLGGRTNSFFGFSAGSSITTGEGNSFFGSSAGRSNTTGTGNSFFGQNAGFSTTEGGLNSFFGFQAGLSNTGTSNSFFGYRSGYENTIGNANSFFGMQAGESNIAFNSSFFGYRAGRNNQRTGSTFFGYQAGMSNTTGFRNAFFGEDAGRDTITGSFNSFFGSLAGQVNTGGNNSFFGAIAGSRNTTGSDNSFFGRAAGNNNTEGINNSFFGSNAGLDNTTGNANSFFGYFAGAANQIGSGNAFFGSQAGNANNNSFNTFLGTSAGRESSGSGNTLVGNGAGANLNSGNNNTFVGFNTGNVIGNFSGSNNTVIGANTIVGNGISYGTAIGADAVANRFNSIILGRSNGADRVVIWGLGGGGSTDLCLNSINEISVCSSSLRYKTNVNFFNPGLNLVKRLQPITFDWKDGGTKDLGLGAETVAEIEPLLVTYNKDGEVEGVKYDRLGVVLLNAVKEQQLQIESQEKQNQELQTRIESQQKQIEEQKTMIENLRAFLCAQNPQAQICQPKEERRDEK